MTSPTPHSDQAIILDQPWQIELYRLYVLRSYCELRYDKNPFVGQRRTLRSINQEFGFNARTFRDAANMILGLIAEKKRAVGISR